MYSRREGLVRLIQGWPASNSACFVLNLKSGYSVVTGDSSRIYNYASVSKLASSIAFLSAVTEGVFHLDQELENGVVIAELLSHSSGLATDIDFDLDIFQQPQVALPRTKRIYSNVGFEMLAKYFEKEAGISFPHYVAEVLFRSSDMGTSEMSGTFWPTAGATGAAAGIRGSLIDLIGLARALCYGTAYLDPHLLSLAKEPYLPELPGVLPGFGEMKRNTWGLGFEVRGDKSPHWTSKLNSPRTFGHFGASGTFLWVDPDFNLALGVLTDRQFGPWAQRSWPELSEYVVKAFAGS